MFRFLNRRATVNGSGHVPGPAPAPAPVDYEYDEAAEAETVEAVEAKIQQRRRVTDRENVLTVGRNVSLQGKVQGCAMLYVEGDAEAKVKDCGALVVAESGSFRGSAQVGAAEIAGQVEGNLTCTGRLVLRATGRINGRIRYGALEIETGGDLAGNIAALPAKQRVSLGESFFGLERFAKKPSFS